jgi:hypothetical protein
MEETGRAPLTLRLWNTLQQRERIVAMSLFTVGAVMIVNSTVWAIAVCVMNRERIRATNERVEPAEQVSISAPDARHIAGDVE